MIFDKGKAKAGARNGSSMIEMHTVYRRRWRNQFVRLASIIAEASVIAAV